MSTFGGKADILATSPCADADGPIRSLFCPDISLRDSGRHPPTDEWRLIKTPEEANQIARTARNNESKLAVEHGRRSWRKREKKTKAGSENALLSVPKK